MLIVSSQTTVESMIIRHMKERESKQLSKAFSLCDIRQVLALMFFLHLFMSKQIEKVYTKRVG